MIRRLLSAAPAFTVRSLIAALAFGWVFSSIPVARACDPVVYLFRHAEEKPGGKLENTLLLVGNQHAELYPSMIEEFQGNNCPVSWVYAMSPYKDNNGAIGTTNPYYTGYPSANILPQRKPQDTIGQRKLFEFLPGVVRSLFLADIKNKLKDSQGVSHSVAIFWSSQGMCNIADTLGSNLPNFDCVSSKPPRNSVYVFAYDPNQQTFTRMGNYIQCFNFKPFATGDLEDKFSFEQTMGFPAGTVPAQYYCQASGNLADDADPRYKAVFGSTEKAANGSMTEDQLTTLLRGKICDLDNLPDNCHQ